MKFYFLPALFLSACFSLPVFAQTIDPIETDRPDQTETVATVPAGHLQMENGFSVEQTNDSTQAIAHPSILLKLGLGERFEIGLIAELNTIKGIKTISGLNPLTVRFKEKITAEHGIVPATSFIGYLSIPEAASPDFRLSFYAPAFRFTMQHSLSDNISLGYNLGAEWDGETAEPVFVYTLTTGVSLTPKLGAYLEVYGFLPQLAAPDHRTDGGFNFRFLPNILFDISGGIGLTENAPDYYAAFGFSFRLKN